MRKDFFSDTEKNNYIKWHLDKCLNQYDKVNYVYAAINKRNTDEILIISDLAASLVDNYINKKTQNIDPVFINALNRISPFSWDENLKINSMWTVKSVYEPIETFNISGYAFIVHDHQNHLALLSLYIDKFLIKDVDFLLTKIKISYRDY